jgi:hypothetical protein
MEGIVARTAEQGVSSQSIAPGTAEDMVAADAIGSRPGAHHASNEAGVEIRAAR